MPGPKDLDEAWVIAAEAIDMVHKDPRRGNQAADMLNGVGKLNGICKNKLVACALKGVEPDFPQLGKLGTKPMKPGAKLLG